MIGARVRQRSHATRIALGVALIAAFVLYAAPARAGALAPPDYYGANVQPIFEKGFVPPSRWNALIADMSPDDLSVARMDAAWAWVEPHAPVNGVHTYDWNPAKAPTHSMDNLVSLFAANGVRMLAVPAIAPGWAGSSSASMVPSHYADYVAYVRALAARYGAGGTFWSQHPALPYLPVQQFEIWTEANSTNFWTRGPDPIEYVKVLKPLYAAVHAVDPSATVLASIGWQNASGYVSELYRDGVKGSIDGLAFHPYAPDVPSTIGLVQQMRATLVAAGDPGLPIYDTEMGEPAAPESIADGARAAMQSLAGDALAHSDCNVQDFDVYALTGSDTGLEPINEGYMGILNDVTGAPTLTGQALIAASRRWQANPVGGIVLCGSARTPYNDLLPLGLKLIHTSPTCVSATITYYGDPLQSAQIILRTIDGRVDPAGTTPAGTTAMCLENGPAITSFTVYAEISNPVNTASFTSPDIAQSATYTCPVSIVAPTAPCPETRPAPRNPITTISTTTTSSRTTSTITTTRTATTATSVTTTAPTPTTTATTSTTRTPTTATSTTRTGTTSTSITPTTTTTTTTVPASSATGASTTSTTATTASVAPKQSASTTTGSATTTTTATTTTSTSGASPTTASGSAPAMALATAPGPPLGFVWMKGCGITLRIAAVGRKHTRIGARLTCHGSRQPGARALLALVRRGRHYVSLYAAFRLTAGHWHTVTLPFTSRPGDRITVRVGADPTTGLPGVSSALLVGAATSHKAHRK